MFHEREPFVRAAGATGPHRTTRRHRAEAALIEHDDDASADRMSIDPLDDRDSRDALRVRRN
jgi:hypothetical protein